jgi:hypothetical protein
MSEWTRPRPAFGGLGLLTLVMFCQPALVAAADSAGSIDGINRGTVGRQQVVVAISEARGGKPGTNYDEPGDWNTYPVSGYYFYRRHGVDIQLAGMPLKDGSVRIREYRKRGFSPYEFPAEWRMRFSGDRTIGVFCKCHLSASTKPARPALKIALRRISPRLPPPEECEKYKAHSGNSYCDLKLDFPDSKGPEIEANAAVAYRMRTDPRFGVSRPELTRFPNARMMSRVNAALDAEYDAARLFAEECLSAGRIGGTYGGFYGETVKVSVFPPDVLAVLVVFDYYSGGAHPGDGSYTLNYNLHTGESFTLEDSFQIEDEWDPVAETARVLARLYRQYYVKPRSPTGIDCDVVLRTNMGAGVKDAFSPSNARLFMAKKGLVIVPVFRTRWEDYCARLTTVPYRELRLYVKKDSLLGRVVDRAER